MWERGEGLIQHDNVNKLFFSLAGKILISLYFLRNLVSAH